MNDKINKSWLTFISYYAIIVLGFSVVITGSALPQITASLGISPSGAGLLTAMWSVGFLLFTAIGGNLSDRASTGTLLSAGTIMIAAALFAFGRETNYYYNIGFMLLLGSGSGIFEAVLNTLIVRLYPNAQVAALNILHAVLGVGTVCGPMLTGAVVGAGMDYRYSFMAVGALTVGFLPLVLLSRFPAPSGGSGGSPVWLVLGMMKVPAFVVLCLGMIFYIGAEYGTNVWITTYLTGVKKMEPAPATRVLSVFWGGLLVGRIVTGLVSRYVKGSTIVLVLSAASFAAYVAGLKSESVYGMYAAFGLFGLGLSGIFPTLLSMAGENNPGLAGTAMGFIIAIGNIGGVFIPWTIAWVSESVGMGSAMYLYLLDITLLIASMAGYVILSSRSQRA